MHAGQDEPLPAGEAEQGATGAGRGGGVHVVGGADVGVRVLQRGAVHEVAGDEEGAYAIGRVAGSVAGSLDGLDAERQGVGRLEEGDSSFIGGQGLLYPLANATKALLEQGMELDGYLAWAAERGTALDNQAREILEELKLQQDQAPSVQQQGSGPVLGGMSL